MKKILPFLALVVLIFGLAYVLYIRGFGFRTGNVEVQEIITSKSAGFRLEEVVSGLYVPWSIVFTSPDRMLVTERDGKIRIVERGRLLEKPLFVFTNVYTEKEAGLMGLTIDPDYSRNKYIYACLSYNKDGKPRIKVTRLKDNGISAVSEENLLDDVLAGAIHDGCRIKFGPDNKLYITLGEAAQKDLAQKLDSLNGKILRINADGSIPADNPFRGSPIYSYGHRNPQGIDWDPQTNLLWATEHGPSGADGPGGGDEINLIKEGANYGWPLVSHDKTYPGTEFPKLLFTPAVAPAAGMFYRGDLFPEFKNNFFFAALRGEGIYRLVIAGDKVISFEKLSGIDVGRIREIVEGPDGAIYFTTSNRDGRGKLREGDDKIYRIVPKE